MSLIDESKNSPYSSFDYTGQSTNRRPSLKEMPSFRDEASKALRMREDLARIKERLSMDREILNQDPASKPWLKMSPRTHQASLRGTVIPEVENSVSFPSSYSHGAGQKQDLHPALPAAVVAQHALERRTRNLSRGTSSVSSDDSHHNYE